MVSCVGLTHLKPLETIQMSLYPCLKAWEVKIKKGFCCDKTLSVLYKQRGVKESAL